VLTPRRQHILIGAISTIVIVAAVTIGIRAAFGEFAGGYRLVATFDAAGQGLISGSDVKIRGVNVGEVDGVRLVDGRAEVTMRIFPGEEIPRTAFAEIRPKTLFGEKFVNVEPGDGEGGPDVLAAGEEIADTRGGFELEQVLSDTYPLLQAVDPVKLAVVLGEMADAGAGLGETVNRSIVNSARLARMQAENLDNMSSFLRDLADLSDELGGRADAFVAGARDLNSALPVLVEGEDDLVELLEQTSRLSRDAVRPHHGQPVVHGRRLRRGVPLARPALRAARPDRPARDRPAPVRRGPGPRRAHPGGRRHGDGRGQGHRGHRGLRAPAVPGRAARPSPG
jgi:phospholipid/cholesterol/gamma-HCH transport system substrate-binding protein